MPGGCLTHARWTTAHETISPLPLHWCSAQANKDEIKARIAQIKKELAETDSGERARRHLGWAVQCRLWVRLGAVVCWLRHGVATVAAAACLPCVGGMQCTAACAMLTCTCRHPLCPLPCSVRHREAERAHCQAGGRRGCYQGACCVGACVQATRCAGALGQGKATPPATSCLPQLGSLHIWASALCGTATELADHTLLLPQLLLQVNAQLLTCACRALQSSAGGCRHRG